MDITRGSLDEISRPACSSRINHGSRNLSGSLEILTPEPSLSKLDYYKKQTEDDSQEHNDGNGEKCGTKPMKTVEDILEQKTNCSSFQLQNTNQVHGMKSSILECILSSVDSEDDCAEENLSGCSTINRDELVKLQAGTAVLPKLLQPSWEPVNFTKPEDSKEKEMDPLLQKAIKKMKRLDQILATKQSHEKAIKKKGREMKTKLWEDFQSMSSQGSSLITEEEENTSRFLALTSSLQETPGPSDVAEDEMFISVFQTQIYPESDDGDGILAKQDCLNEDRSSIKKIESTHQKNDMICKKTPSFIKKNIELAKDSGNQMVILEEEKKRLSELLKDIEDENSDLQIIEEEPTGWLVPGEGYTPAPMEFHHLAEIDARLELIISNGDLSTVRNSCLTVHQHIYKASQAYANRTLETVPGDIILRDTKEIRDQQNRLKEIDQQLKNLEETPDMLPCLSGEQLHALLQECKQSQRTANGLPVSQRFLLPSCDTPGNAVPDSRNGLLRDAHSVGMLTSQETAGAQEGDRCSKEMMETADCHIDKTLVEFHLSENPMTEKKLNGPPEGQEEMAWYHSSSKNSFLSMALNRDRPKKPSFFDEPFYCMNLNNELSTDVDIPSIPLPTRGDFVTVLPEKPWISSEVTSEVIVGSLVMMN